MLELPSKSVKDIYFLIETCWIGSSIHSFWNFPPLQVLQSPWLSAICPLTHVANEDIRTKQSPTAYLLFNMVPRAVDIRGQKEQRPHSPSQSQHRVAMPAKCKRVQKKQNFTVRFVRILYVTIEEHPGKVLKSIKVIVCHRCPKPSRPDLPLR